MIERPLSIPIIMVFQRPDQAPRYCNIPTQYQLAGSSTATYELVGQVDYNPTKKHFTTQFCHPNSTTLYHYDDLQGEVWEDPNSGTINDLAGNVPMDPSPSSSVNSYVYHLVNAKAAQESFFTLCCQELLIEFHISVKGRLVTGEYELQFCAEQWQLSHSRNTSQRQTWDYVPINLDHLSIPIANAPTGTPDKTWDANVGAGKLFHLLLPPVLNILT